MTQVLTDQDPIAITLSVTMWHAIREAVGNNDNSDDNEEVYVALCHKINAAGESDPSTITSRVCEWQDIADILLDAEVDGANDPVFANGLYAAIIKPLQDHGFNQ